MADLPRRLVSNWQLKLLALTLAVLLWTVVSGENVRSEWISVPLLVRVEDPTHQLSPESVPREVEVRFLGPGREFIDVAIRRPPLVLEVAEVEDTVQTIQLEPDMVMVPNQLEVSARDIRPGSLRLRFRRLESRSVPVRVRVSGTIGRQWVLVDSFRVRPAYVDVTGPASRLEGLEAVLTEPLRLLPGDSIVARTVSLDTSELQGLNLSVHRVRVVGRVERVAERTVVDVPVSLAPGLVAQPGSVDVRLRGAAGAVQLLRPTDLRVVAALDSLPSPLPAGGALVPLRVETERPGISAVPVPQHVRVGGEGVPLDTLRRPEDEEVRDRGDGVQR